MENGGGVFLKTSGKWGVFFVKKWTFPKRRVNYVQYQYFLFYVLLIWGVRTNPTHPLCLRAWPGQKLWFIGPHKTAAETNGISRFGAHN